MDDAIEGNFSVVKVKQPGRKIRYQATIKAQTDHKLANLENPIFEAEKLTKEGVYEVLVPYLVKRVNFLQVRQIFDLYLRGGKCKMIRHNANKYEYQFALPDGTFIENYHITVIEI